MRFYAFVFLVFPQVILLVYSPLIGPSKDRQEG